MGSASVRVPRADTSASVLTMRRLTIHVDVRSLGGDLCKGKASALVSAGCVAKETGENCCNFLPLSADPSRRTDQEDVSDKVLSGELPVFGLLLCEQSKRRGNRKRRDRVAERRMDEVSARGTQLRKASAILRPAARPSRIA